MDLLTALSELDEPSLPAVVKAISGDIGAGLMACHKTSGHTQRICAGFALSQGRRGIRSALLRFFVLRGVKLPNDVGLPLHRDMAEMIERNQREFAEC